MSFNSYSGYKEVNLNIPLTGKQIFKAILITFFTLGFLSLIYGLTLNDFFDKFTFVIYGSMGIGITFVFFMTLYCPLYDIDRNPFHYIGYCFHLILKEGD